MDPEWTRPPLMRSLAEAAVWLLVIAVGMAALDQVSWLPGAEADGFLRALRPSIRSCLGGAVSGAFIAYVQLRRPRLHPGPPGDDPAP